MGDFTITFARSARKELEALAASTVNRIFSKIEMFVKNRVPEIAENCKERKIYGEFGLVIIEGFMRFTKKKE